MKLTTNNKQLTTSVLFVILTGIFVFPSYSSASPPIPQYPGNLSSIYSAVGNASTEGIIPADLAMAQCGGWDWDQSVLGKIAEVQGLPGHILDDPLGNVTSGMATRNAPRYAGGEGMTTCGFRSACRPMGAPVEGWFTPPFYRQLPCQRPLGGIDPENQPGDPPPRNMPIEFSCGGGEMPTDGYVCPSLLAEGMDGGLCEWLNERWLFGYYQNNNVPVDHYCDDGRIEKGNGAWQTVPFNDWRKNPLCTITNYGKNSPCRAQHAGDVFINDMNSQAIPADPGLWALSWPANRLLDFEDIRECCTFQSITGMPWGPEGGAGDPSGDFIPFWQNCITCQNSECRFAEECSDYTGEPEGSLDEAKCTKNLWPTRSRWQYYPPFQHDMEKDSCSYCVDENDKPIACNHPDAGDPIYPCAIKYALMSRFDPELNIHYINRERGLRYRSFYRFYMASYKREEVLYTPVPGSPQTGEDAYKKADIPVSCYRLYEEFDPKYRPTTESEKACVIAAYYTGQLDDKPLGEELSDRNFYEMGRNATGTPTQEGKGQFRQTMEDINAIESEPDFNFDDDDWSPNKSDAFHMTSGEDITAILQEEASNETNLKSSIQVIYTMMDMPDVDPHERHQDYSPSSFVKSFDDSAFDSGDRYFVRWWQDIETKGNLLMSEPVVRLILPPSWSIGLDPLDPIFTAPKYEKTEGRGADPRMQALEVQLRADEDLLDNMKAYLKKGLLPTFVEEPIPVLVPLGSPMDFRALAEGWAKYYSGESGDAVADEDIILMLEHYARQIEEVRKLRAEIAWYNQKLMEYQTTVTNEIANWMTDDVIYQYEDFRNQISAIATNLRAKWLTIHASLTHLNQYTMMPWCHNSKYTLPIYTQLDPWMPRQWEDGKPMEYMFPELNMEKNLSASFDFSGLKPAEGTIKVPVIRPIQVSIDMNKLDPPEPGEENVTVPKLPEFPPVPSIREYITNHEDIIYPTTRIGERPPSLTFSVFDSGEINLYSTELDNILGFVTGMARVYGGFWLTQSTFHNDKKPAPKTEQDCYMASNDMCFHHEMDLNERLTRFGARPAIYLEEDLHPEAMGDIRDILNVGHGLGTCKDDWACEAMNPSGKYPQEGWNIIWEGEDPNLTNVCIDSEGGSFIDQLRACMFRETLSRPGVNEEPTDHNFEGLFPYSIERNRIVPSFGTPTLPDSLVPQQ